MDRRVINLEENHTLIFEDEFCLIYRENALSEKTKKIEIRYDEVNEIKYRPRKIKWLWSIVYFVLLVFLETVDNPISGKERKIELKFKNGEKRFIEVDSINREIIDEVIDEFNVRKNMVTASI